MSARKPPKSLFFYTDSRSGVDLLFGGFSERDRDEMQKEEPKATIVEYRLVETPAKRKRAKR